MSSISSFGIKPKPLFHEVLSKIQKDVESALPRSDSREKISQLANEFFTYLQENLGLFNGADLYLNVLIERLQPFKSAELLIEPLLTKINKDLRDQNRSLMDDSSKKVVPFSSSLAAFPLPLVDTTMECAELTTQFLRKEKHCFSLFETLEMCCLLIAQNMKTEAIRLFNLHTIKHFVQDPQAFTKQLLDYPEKTQWSLKPIAIKNNITILRRLFQTSLIESPNRDLFSRIPHELFIWLQNGESGEKELFQGYEQLVCKEYSKAFEYYKQAAGLGNSQALIAMGSCYWFGNGVPAQDCNKAFEYYNQAAELGSSEGLVGMGNCYWTGNGVLAQNCNKAFEYYNQAAELGNSQALVEMGYCYWLGNGVLAQNCNKAFEYYNQAAELGNSQALIAIGTCYWFGNGVPAQDCNKAFEYYNQAAELGNSQALVEIGDCYWCGKGVSAQNCNKAFEYWLEAKKFGDDSGAFKVAQCLTWGKGAQKDLDAAKAILLDLISRNISDAQAFYKEKFLKS